METTVDIKPFRFSLITHMKYKDYALDAIEFNDFLNAEIDLSSYTKKLVTIGFIPIIIETAASTIHEEVAFYNATKKEIFIQKRISPEEDMKAFFVSELEKFVIDLPELEKLIVKIKEVLFLLPKLKK